MKVLQKKLNVKLLSYFLQNQMTNLSMLRVRLNSRLNPFRAGSSFEIKSLIKFSTVEQVVRI